MVDSTIAKERMIIRTSGGRRQRRYGCIALACVAGGAVFSSTTKYRGLQHDLFEAESSAAGGRATTSLSDHEEKQAALIAETACDDYEENSRARDLCRHYCNEKACYKHHGDPTCDSIEANFVAISQQRSMPCYFGCPCWEISDMVSFIEDSNDGLFCNQKPTYDEIVANSTGPLKSFLSQSGPGLPQTCMNFVAAPTIVRHITVAQAEDCREQIRKSCRELTFETASR